MASVQCKMCGYVVELPDGLTVGECPACGSVTTFPKIASEHAGQLYARAEHFRQINDFDKAIDAYEAIVREQPDDAEAYWGIVLSRFGIEYVEDPVSHERVPTCHRVQYDSILADGDYRSALENADASQRDVYEAEAKRIAEIQKGILAISAQEKPFDVFICYKETTEGGSRTKDSAIAQDIYYQLANEGYKVFFARITLEDKLGQQYEPYIFAALNSAKVMLVVGTRKEHFDAVWVRNEWSRFLALMKRDRSRLLIPCYRDMDAYDIPEELSMLQSQDMSKIGFVQDLLRGVRKVLGGNRAAGAAASQAQGDSGVQALLKRITVFLETEDYGQAKEYCNKVLDKAPENAEAYLFLLLAENQRKSVDELYSLRPDLESLKYFQVAMKFADAPLKARLQAQIKLQKDDRAYRDLAWRLKTACTVTELQEIAKGLGRLGDFGDAKQRLHACEERLEALKSRAYEKYQLEYQRMREMVKNGVSAEEWQNQAKVFREMDDIPEAAGMADICEENCTILMYNNLIGKMNVWLSKGYFAMNMWNNLATAFDNLKGAYHCPTDAAEMAGQCREHGRRAQYKMAMDFKNKKNYDNAIVAFEKILDFADSKQQIQACRSLASKKKVYTRLAIAALVVVIGVAAFIAHYNSAEAWYNRGLRYHNGEGVPKDMTEAVKWYRKAAEQGLAEAQFNLGVLYGDGEGVPKNDAEAVKWFRKAAEQGLAEAQYNLGLCYNNGEGVPKDDAEAVKWFRKAAEQGHAEAQYNLGLCYNFGFGVLKDDTTEAVKWFRKAAEQGHAGAQGQLGICYSLGEGVPKDMTKAVKWYRKAAEQGLAEAQFLLGVLYDNGEGVPKDMTEAVKWYRMAAEQGNAEAQCNLGVCYGNGEGVPKDMEEAVRWFRKSAEQGYAEAQCNLGVCYGNGEGVPQDMEEAVRWFRKATEQGHAGAQEALQYLGK